MKQFGCALVMLFCLQAVSLAAGSAQINVTTHSGSLGRDTIVAGVSTALEFHIANNVQMGGFQVPITLSSPDGVTWTWNAQLAGWGTHKYVTHNPESRIDPPAELFDVTGGLIVSEYYLPEGILVGAAAAMGPGMAPGTLEEIFAVHITATQPADESTHQLCVDVSTTMGVSTLAFGDIQGSDMYIVLLDQNSDGKWCFPVVRYSCDEFDGLFCDDFDSTAALGWKTSEGDCTWQVVDGAYHASLTGQQLSCVQSAGDSSWSNYIFEVKVRGNAGVDKIVRFRERDASTRYFVNIRSDWQGQDEAMLGKQIDGIETILETVVYPSQNGVWYNLRITCVDEHISLSIDGNQVISFDDDFSRIYAGGIGLVCFTGEYGSSDVDFDGVRISAPFPYVVFDGETSYNVGDEIMISGVITYWTEKSFPVGSGVCTVENPINRQSTDVIVDADGSFSCQLTAAMEETGTFTASLGISTEYGIARSYFSFAVNDPAIGPPYDDNHQADFVVDMHLDMGQADDLPSQSTQNVSVKPGFWNQYWSSLSNSTVDNFVEPSKDLYRQEASFVTGGWKRTTESYSGKLAAGAFNAGVAKCSPISASGVSHCALGLGAVYVLGAETFSNTFNEAFHQLVDIASNPADPILTPEEAARGHVLADDISMILNVLRMKPTDGGLLKAVKTTMNAGFLVPKYIQLVNKHLDLNDKSGSGADNLESLSLIVVDSANDIIVIGVEPKAENMCVVQSFSPVRLSVTDPRGRVVDWMSSEVSGSRYFRMDTDQDGDSSTLVMIPLDTVGPVSVTVVPDAGAQPDDCFTILMDNTYYQTPIPLADNIPVSAIPAQPLVAETFQNLPPDSAQIITVDGAMFGEFPCAIQWHPAIDPNPGHIPSYRVVIARSEDYSDSVMVSVSSDTTYTVEASLLPAPKGSADTLHFYWKVIASDDWGEVAATAFREFSVMVLCGDANSDSKINVGDAVYIISYIFRGGPAPVPLGAADANCDDKINSGDAVYIVSYIFRGGPAPCCP